MPATYYKDDNDKRESNKILFFILISGFIICLFLVILFPKTFCNHSQNKNAINKEITDTLNKSGTKE